MVNSEDVALLIKLQKRVKHLEATKRKLTEELDEREDKEETMFEGDFAFHSLKVSLFPCLSHSLSLPSALELGLFWVGCIPTLFFLISSGVV